MALSSPPRIGTSAVVSRELIRPNAFNPNQMDDDTFRKEIESIRRFGFIDPVTVREVEGGFEILDGEHRWRAAGELDLPEIPITNLGTVDDSTAKQITVVLNELRGEPNREKLGTLLRGLLATETTADLLEVLPFSEDDFKDLVELPDFDWGALDQPTPTANPSAGAKWVERTFRLPPDAAEVVDDALRKAQKDEDDMADWQALEAICADFMGGP